MIWTNGRDYEKVITPAFDRLFRSVCGWLFRPLPAVHSCAKGYKYQAPPPPPSARTHFASHLRKISFEVTPLPYRPLPASTRRSRAAPSLRRKRTTTAPVFAARLTSKPRSAQQEEVHSAGHPRRARPRLYRPARIQALAFVVYDRRRGCTAC